MKTRLRFYGPPLITGLLSLVYLVFFVYYDWSVSNYQTLKEAFGAIVSRNPRWVTWGAWAAGLGLIVGLIVAVGFLLSDSEEEYFEEVFFDIPKAFPSARGIGIFILLLFVFMLTFNEDWRLGLRDSFEFIGVIAWAIFLVTTLIILPTLLVDIFYKGLLILILKGQSEKGDED